MFRSILSAAIAAAMALGIAASAEAYSGKTTNTTYKTASQAALHTGAYYFSKFLQKPTPASQLRIIKQGKTPSGKVSSSWQLATRKLTPFGYPLAKGSVKVKKLNAHAWKGYSDGKNAVYYVK